MQGVMTALRSFCKFLVDAHITEINQLSAFRTSVAPRRKVIFGFTRHEVDAILNAVDKETAIGKRDYAILLLAKKTGLPKSKDFPHGETCFDTKQNRFLLIFILNYSKNINYIVSPNYKKKSAPSGAYHK